jgi:hypothetical protein
MRLEIQDRATETWPANLVRRQAPLKDLVPGRRLKSL